MKMHSVTKKLLKFFLISWLACMKVLANDVPANSDVLEIQVKAMELQLAKEKRLPKKNGNTKNTSTIERQTIEKHRSKHQNSPTVTRQNPPEVIEQPVVEPPPAPVTAPIFQYYQAPKKSVPPKIPVQQIVESPEKPTPAPAKKRTGAEKYLDEMSTKSKGNAIAGTTFTILCPILGPSFTTSSGDKDSPTAMTDPTSFGNPDSMIAKAMRLQSEREKKAGLIDIARR